MELSVLGERSLSLWVGLMAGMAGMAGMLLL